MGFPMRKAAARGALIGVMLGGGLLYAGISQAQDAGIQGERDAELIAASGGPATTAHLIPYEADKAAVDVRDDDVAASQSAVNTGTPLPAVSAVAAPVQPHAVTTAQAGPANR